MVSPDVSVLVSVYRREDFLRLVLEGLARQSDHAFEVVVAEDDQSPSVAACVQAFYPVLGNRLLHVCQEDRGFRKTRILNAAIRASRAPFVVFLDGDCIPHRRFVAAYHRAAASGVAFYGRRLMLGPRITSRLVEGRSSCPPSFFELLRSDSTRRWQGVRLPLPRRQSRLAAIWGCNWGVNRSHIEEVNGFDEDYVCASVGEDVDVEWRLRATGVRVESIKHQAIVYHLHHPAAYSSQEENRNLALLAYKQRIGRIRPDHGLHGTAAADSVAVAGGAW